MVNVHENFRLWITAMSATPLPASVLEKSIKIANEPAVTLRQNLLNIYKGMKEEDLEESRKPDIFKKLVFALSNFHAAVMDRKRYEENGWNLQYEWTRTEF